MTKDKGLHTYIKCSTCGEMVRASRHICTRKDFKEENNK